MRIWKTVLYVTCRVLFSWVMWILKMWTLKIAHSWIFDNHQSPETAIKSTLIEIYSQIYIGQFSSAVKCDIIPGIGESNRNKLPAKFRKLLSPFTLPLLFSSLFLSCPLFPSISPTLSSSNHFAAFD